MNDPDVGYPAMVGAGLVVAAAGRRRRRPAAARSQRLVVSRGHLRPLPTQARRGRAPVAAGHEVELARGRPAATDCIRRHCTTEESNEAHSTSCSRPLLGLIADPDRVWQQRKFHSSTDVRCCEFQRRPGRPPRRPAARPAAPTRRHRLDHRRFGRLPGERTARRHLRRRHDGQGRQGQQEAQHRRAAVYIAALKDGSIDFFPEYTGSILAYLDTEGDGEDARPTSSPRCRRRSRPTLAVLKYAPAQDSDTITVTKATARSTT